MKVSKAIAWWVSGLCAAGLGTAASAQYTMPDRPMPSIERSAADSDLPSRPEPLEGAALWRFSQCVAARDAVLVDGLLSATPHSREADSAISSIGAERYAGPCVEGTYPSGGLVMNRTHLRGGLAQSRYLAKYPDDAPTGIADAEPIAISVETYNARIAFAEDQVSEVMRVFGDCVVAARPMVVDGLLRSEAGSDAEGTAIAALGDTMGPCLWEGQSIQFDRESLRATLADALYRKSEGWTVLTAEAVQTNASRSDRQVER